MNFKKISLSALMIATLSLSLVSCKDQAAKDAELKAKIEAVANGATVTVKDGVATLSGESVSETDKVALEEAVKKIDGVKSVTNNLSVPPPPVINADNTIEAAVKAVIANYPGVAATVANGVVTLTGDIKRADLTTLMQSVNALNAGKIDNKLNIK